MIHFLIIKSTRKDAAEIIRPAEGRIDDYVPNSSSARKEQWTSADKSTLVRYWMMPDANFEDAYHVSSGAEFLKLFLGWINDGKPLKTKLADRKTSEMDEHSAGEYALLELSNEGEGRLVRSLMGSVQLYYGITSDCVVIASRASLVGKIVQAGQPALTTFDRNYISWILSTSWALDDSSLFEGVKILRQGVSVQFTREGYRFDEPAGDIWDDQSLQERYRSDRKGYWDECFERMVSNLNLFFESYRSPFRLPVSGGKDSRLLLALIRASRGCNLISEAYTNGPPFSGEVIAGRLLSSVLGIPHKYVDGNYVGVSFDGKFHRHLFFTEAEISPIDFTPGASKNFPRIVLRGQESGLRNISGVTEEDFDKIRNWLVIHFGEFNRAGILKAEAVSSMQDRFDHYLRRERSRVRLVTDLPTKNRIESRFLRWGARVWSLHNQMEFSPFLFLDSLVVKHTYNAGPASRIEEEFHYEMMSRADQRLLGIPFFQQGWNGPDQAKIPVIRHHRANSRLLRGSQAILYKNWDSIKRYVQRPASRKFLDGIVDWKKLEGFQMENFRSGHYEPLWQLVQCSLLADAEDFTEQALARTLETPDFPSLADKPEGEPKGFEQRAEEYGEGLLELLVEKAGRMMQG